jgi:hypothetical protein
MLTPFDIKAKLSKIESDFLSNTRFAGISLARSKRTLDHHNLCLEVLEEIASGSPDPKTLAKTLLRGIEIQ